MGRLASYLPQNIKHVEGNGICINPNCSLIGTLPDIQIMLGQWKVKVDGRSASRTLCRNSRLSLFRTIRSARFIRWRDGDHRREEATMALSSQCGGVMWKILPWWRQLANSRLLAGERD